MRSLIIAIFIALSLSIGNGFTQEVSDIRDIRPPVYFPFNALPFIITGIILFVALIIFLVVFFLKKRKKKKLAAPIITKSAYEIACEALQLLTARDLVSQGRIKEYYSEISDIVRHYLENQLNIRAPEMTTEEFLLYVRNADSVSAVHKNLLKAFLSQCDRVKFARYGPDKTEIGESFVRAQRFIDETKDTIAAPKEVFV